MQNFVLQSDSRDFESEMSKLRGKRKPVSTTVNGKNNDLDIACAFSDHYNNLFNYVTYHIEDRIICMKKYVKIVYTVRIINML